MKIKSRPDAVQFIAPIIGDMNSPSGPKIFVGKDLPGRFSAEFEGILEEPNNVDVVQATLDAIAKRTRVDVNFLLNSPGGYMHVYEVYERMMKTARASRGEVRSYVPCMAGSAAAMLWAKSDRRYTCASAAVTFHARARETYESRGVVLVRTADGVVQPARLVEVHEEVPEDMRSEDRAFMQRFLLSGKSHHSSRAAVSSHLARTFADPKNHRDEVTFSGRSCGQLGLTQVCDSVRDIRRAFERDVGCSVNNSVPTLEDAWVQVVTPFSETF